MSFFMPPQVLSSALETILNQGLKRNLNNNDGLHNLVNKQLLILLTELSFPLAISVTKINEQYKLLVTSPSANENCADCTISTSVKSLWQLKKTQQLTELIKQDQLNIDGDIKIAQQFVGIFEAIDIDWQSELAKQIGDIPTYQLTQLVDKVKTKVGFAASQIPADASEWLIHEKKLVVPNSELLQFHQAVKETEIATEALAVKIKQLTENIKTIT